MVRLTAAVLHERVAFYRSRVPLNLDLNLGPSPLGFRNHLYVFITHDSSEQHLRVVEEQARGPLHLEVGRNCEKSRQRSAQPQRLPAGFGLAGIVADAKRLLLQPGQGVRTRPLQGAQGCCLLVPNLHSSTIKQP